MEKKISKHPKSGVPHIKRIEYRLRSFALWAETMKLFRAIKAEQPIESTIETNQRIHEIFYGEIPIIS